MTVLAPIGLVLSLLLASMVFVPIGQAPTQASFLGTLSMTKLSTTASQTSPGCYSGYVSMNMTWTNSNATYPISVQAFFVVIAISNQIVGNQTSTSYVSPSNTITQLLLFPNLPVTLRVSFQKVCATPSSLRLIYVDSNFFFTFGLP
jgi:hypothetical protein